ncbi:pentapeptide repeat-containing protein [Saccharopolyspora tripterygii]
MKFRPHTRRPRWQAVAIFSFFLTVSLAVVALAVVSVSLSSDSPDKWSSIVGATGALATAIFTAVFGIKSSLQQHVTKEFGKLERIASEILSERAGSAREAAFSRLREALIREGIWSTSDAREFDTALKVRNEIVHGDSTGSSYLRLIRSRQSLRHLYKKTSAFASKSYSSDIFTTELYDTAMEQLISDKSAVRMAGIYALGRLGQANPDHRQTVVNLLCAYLRFPVTFPESDSPETEDQVRIAAQNMLIAHLRPDRDEQDKPTNPDFWPDIDIDLSTASLNQWNFTRCETRSAVFTGASFDGETWFDLTSFSRRVSFAEARFNGYTSFGRARFADQATFDSALFNSDVSFDEASFHRGASFTEAHLNGYTSFGRARFADQATFDSALFNSDVSFDEASFHRGVSFTEAQVKFDRHTPQIAVWPEGWTVLSDDDSADNESRWGELVYNWPTP